MKFNKLKLNCLKFEKSFIIKFIVFIIILFFVVLISNQKINNIKINKNNVEINLNSEIKNNETQKILVTKVIDGDTIELENGARVRYIGIDTPEMNFYKNKKPECFALEAKLKNQELILNKKVRLKTDKKLRDKYNRLLYYVFVGKIFINKELVLQGFAKSKTYKPNILYQDEFDLAEKEAKENNIGMWKKCN